MASYQAWLAPIWTEIHSRSDFRGHVISAPLCDQAGLFIATNVLHRPATAATNN
jgi:hypothetical protein